MTDDKYISAKKLKAHYAWWGDTEERKTFDAIVDVQPAADVKEVVHAEWVEDGYYDGEIVCSNCGTPAIINAEKEVVKSFYCPWCGAIMDGRENGNERVQIQM